MKPGGEERQEMPAASREEGPRLGRAGVGTGNQKIQCLTASGRRLHGGGGGGQRNEDVRILSGGGEGGWGWLWMKCNTMGRIEEAGS